MNIFNKTTSFLLFCLLLSLNTYSQNICENKASVAVCNVEIILQEKLEGRKRIIFTVADKVFIVVTKDGEEYIEYFWLKIMKTAYPN